MRDVGRKGLISKGQVDVGVRDLMSNLNPTSHVGDNYTLIGTQDPQVVIFNVGKILYWQG